MKKILIVMLGIILGVGIFVSYKFITSPRTTVCTMEAKICSDGSAVVRSGTNCDFDQCPISLVDSNWKTFTDTTRFYVSYQYPEDFNTTYIHPAINFWPPAVSVEEKKMNCFVEGSEVSADGKTSKIKINNREFCVTEKSEGAAGSVFTDYVYSFQKENKMITLYFTIQKVQCVNYDEPQKSDCEKEQKAFDLNLLVEKISETIK
ncbi:MAG: hypothetical protein WCT18_00205 [Patescibacteria group bacterium]